MTASQMKRIRAKLEQARVLTAAAHELAVAGRGEYQLREITARVADEADGAILELAKWDERNRQSAAAIAASLGV